jgi:DNA-binding phage protein
MTEAELIQQVRAVRYGRTPSIQSIAQAAGMTRDVLYKAMKSGHLPERHRASLASVMQHVAKGLYYNPRLP